MKSEHEMREYLKAFLELQGYYVLWPDDLGGGDFFDCIAVGDTVGAIELKLSNPKKAITQAYERLFYVNWAAILMPSSHSLKTAKKYDEPYNWNDGRLAGLWHFTGEGIRVIREADSGEALQPNKHTIKMVRLIKKYKELGIPNEQVWGHERGISLMGLQSPQSTMYGKSTSHLKNRALDEFEEK